MMWKLFKVYLRTVTITEGLAGDLPLRVKQFFKQNGKKFFFLSLQLIFCFFLICDFTGFTTPPPSVGAAPSMRACAKLYSALYLILKDLAGTGLAYKHHRKEFHLCLFLSLQ